MHRPRRLILAALVATIGLAACGDDGDRFSSTAPAIDDSPAVPSDRSPTTEPAADPEAVSCDELSEAVHPDSGRHVLPGVDLGLGPAPTSGPHIAAGELADGAVLDEPLEPAAQIGVLEAGAIVVQHRPPETRPPLEPIGIVIAPNPDLTADVVATAWTVRLSCDGADIDRLAAFVAEHRGGGPGGHG